MLYTNGNKRSPVVLDVISLAQKRTFYADAQLLQYYGFIIIHVVATNIETLLRLRKRRHLMCISREEFNNVFTKRFQLMALPMSFQHGCNIFPCMEAKLV